MLIKHAPILPAFQILGVCWLGYSLLQTSTLCHARSMDEWTYNPEVNIEQPHTKGLYTEPGWGNSDKANEKTERTFLYWDGHWTEGRSGISPELPNHKSSDGKSGLDDFRHYRQVLDAIPFKEADPFEANEHGGRDYSPHTLVRIVAPILLGDITLQPGYYQFKIGGLHELPTTHKSIPKNDDAYIKPHAKQGIVIIKKRGMIIGYLPVSKKIAHQHTAEESKKHSAFSLWETRDEYGYHYLIIMDDGKYDYHITARQTQPLF